MEDTKVVKHKEPSQCLYWEKPELAGKFTDLVVYEKSSHFSRKLLQCDECGQLYFYEFYEEVDWEGGNDPQYYSYIPVESKEVADRLSRLDKFELLNHFPRLQRDWPSDQKEPKVWWNGKEDKSKKKLLGMWNVQDVLKRGDKEELAKVSEKIAGEMNEKVYEIQGQQNNLVYSQRIQEAIDFAINVHQLSGEPQYRKGKSVPYVTHPLTVGLILSQAGAGEDVVVAGILHDTIEDCDPYGSVTKEMLAEKFGEIVAELVDAVSEKNKELSWHERKEAALEEIRHFSHDSLLVKSGDVISNSTELIADYEKDGEKTFERFNAPKEESVGHTIEVIKTIISGWEESPLAGDLRDIEEKLELILGGEVSEMVFVPNMK